MDSRLEELSFTYFPENYRWSHGLLIGLNMAPWGGAEIGEVNRIGLRLKNRVGDDDAWFREWSREARKVEDTGRERIAEGYTTSGARYLHRASAYYHVGERFLQPKSKEGLDAYMRGVACFRDAAKYIKRPRMEHVEIPYDGKSLPAVYVHAESANSSGKVPAVVFFDGLDVTKEIQYFKGVADLVARGIACLIVDGPGNGESIRFRNLYLRHDTEHYATPVFDYLAARPEVDAKRIGVMAISLGGYYAPRSAAFEPRFAACIAWGAQWDYHAVWKERLDRIARGEQLSLSVAWEHLLWIFGASTKEEALKRLEGFRRLVLDHDALDNAAAVANLREQQLAALAQVVEPPAQGGINYLLIAPPALAGSAQAWADYRQSTGHLAQVVTVRPGRLRASHRHSSSSTW